MHGEAESARFGGLEDEVGVFLLHEPLVLLEAFLLEGGVGGLFVEVGLVHHDLRACLSVSPLAGE